MIIASPQVQIPIRESACDHQQHVLGATRSEQGFDI
jgi:hypothetical protein